MRSSSLLGDALHALELCQHAHAWSSGRTTRSWSTPRLKLLLNLFIHPSECFGWHAHFLVLRGARWVWVLRGCSLAETMVLSTIHDLLVYA